jgi:hypothetical protein
MKYTAIGVTKCSIFQHPSDKAVYPSDKAEEGYGIDPSWGHGFIESIYKLTMEKYLR